MDWYFRMSTRQERAERRMARKDANLIGVENAPPKMRSVRKNSVPEANAKPKSVPVVAVQKNGAVKPLSISTNKIDPPVEHVRTRRLFSCSPRANVGIATAQRLPEKSKPQLSSATQETAACFGIASNARKNVVIKIEPISPVTLYSQLKALGDRGGFITNAEEFECVICFATIEIGDGVRLRECLHQFCYDCIKSAIMLGDEADVPCPFGDGVTKCEAALLESEIRAILSASEYDKYLKRSLRIAEGTIQNTIHCKLADCDGWCICEDNVNKFECPKCKSVNCVSCQVSVLRLHACHRIFTISTRFQTIHHGLDCKQYQEKLKYEGMGDAERTEKYFEDLIEKKRAMKCPKCQVCRTFRLFRYTRRIIRVHFSHFVGHWFSQIVIMKRDGCDWVQCSMCRLEICWVTKQARWGPNGRGDTSGGCRCKVNNIKCHPNCRFCH